MNTVTKGLTLASSAILMTMACLGSAGAQQQSTPATTLRVENTRDVPVVVYLDRGDFETRLGMVPANQTLALRLPRTLEEGEEIQVFVHPEGGMDLATEALTVNLGKEMEIYVPRNNVGYIPPPPPPTIPDPGEGTTTVTVQNNRAVPVTVFIDHGNFDTRIGMVPPNKEMTLLIPEWIVREKTEAEIFVHPEGQADLSSWTLELSRGAHLFVKVPVA